MAVETRLMVFAHLGTAWVPCGQLLLTEEGPDLLASSYAYGLNYLKRADALEVDPVSLSIADREAVRGKRLWSANGFTLTKPSACQLIADVWRIVRQWRVHWGEFGVSETEQGKVASAFRHLDEISTPALRRQLP